MSFELPPHLAARVRLAAFPDSTTLALAAGARFLDDATGAKGAAFHIALAGGRIAREFFLATTVQARLRKSSLDRVSFFWGDERCVPPDHAESNYCVAAEFLLDPLHVSTAQIHRIRGELEPEAAAAGAAADLCRCAPQSADGQPVLDLVLLGMGEDGHVASLFPGEPDEAMNSPAVYRAVTASKPPPRRVTLGYGALAAARRVWVLASGAGKEAALRESLSPEGRTPLARLLRLRRETEVFTDLA